MGKWIGWYGNDYSANIQGTVAGDAINDTFQNLANTKAGWAVGSSSPDGDKAVMVFVPDSTALPVSMTITNSGGGTPAPQNSFIVEQFDIFGNPIPPNKPK